MELINDCIKFYRFSSALRFQQFIKCITTTDALNANGNLYLIKSKLDNCCKDHYDLVYVSNSGYICCTSNEYFEYGFYDRHIIALYLSGYIDLHPMHQCSTFWLNDCVDYDVSVAIETIQGLNSSITKQHYVYDHHYSQFDMAISMTRDAYNDIKNPIETVTLETAMTYVSNQEVEILTNESIVKQCFIDLKKLKLFKHDELVKQLLQLTVIAKNTCSKKKVVITSTNNEKITIPQFDVKKQEVKRDTNGERKKRERPLLDSNLMHFTRKDDDNKSNSLFSKTLSHLVNMISPSKQQRIH